LRAARPDPGRPSAKPFVTRHNPLEQQRFLRITQELYLKRPLVGGFDRVFEINRSYRNGGILVRHNSQLKMMEFCAAYWNQHDPMDFAEQVLRQAASATMGSASLGYNPGTVVEVG
jgi:lysyl-tRNA synthetase class 2